LFAAGWRFGSPPSDVPVEDPLPSVTTRPTMLVEPRATFAVPRFAPALVSAGSLTIMSDKPPLPVSRLSVSVTVAARAFTESYTRS